MAKLFDMFYNAPAVDVSGTLRELNAGDQANRLRNRQTASDMLTRSAVNTIRSRFDSDKSLSAGIPQADAEFNRAYSSMQAVSPDDAERMKNDYGVSRNRAVGRSLAAMYGNGGQEALLKGLVEQDPSAAASLITRENAIASGIKPEDRLQVEIRNLRTTISSEGFKNFDLDYQKQKIAQLKELEAQQASSKYGNGDAAAAQPSNEQSAFETARTEADAIISGAADVDGNGIIDDESARKTELEDLIRKYGMSARDGDALRYRLQAKADEFAKVAGAKKEKEEQAYQRTQREKDIARQEQKDRDAQARQLEDEVAKYGKLQLAYNNLLKNPNDKTAKSSALTSILRNESGAAIGNSEFLGRMREWLDPQSYNALISDMTGAGMIVSGYIASNVGDAVYQKIMNKYLDRVNTPKLTEFMRYIPPKRVLGVWDKEAPKPPTPKQGAAKSGSKKVGGFTVRQRGEK